MAKERYRKVAVRIWNDEKFRLFSDDGKLAFLFLLTHPCMTSIGAMRASIEGLAAELGWKHRRLIKALTQSINDGMVLYDSRAPCLVLPNFLKHNSPENPNVLKSWLHALIELPECELKRNLKREIFGLVSDLKEPFQEALSESDRIYLADSS